MRAARTSVLGAVLAAILAAPALGDPDNSPSAVTNLPITCDGVTLSVTVAGVPPAPMVSAASGRPGIGFLGGDSTAVQVPKQLRAYVPGESEPFDVISWGYGAQAHRSLTTCTFAIGPYIVELDVMTTPS
jgi:hypothetical protein